MPKRFIYPSICTSESIDSLSYQEEVLFYRLLTVVDDYGRYDARVMVLKGSCFPLKNTALEEIQDGLKRLQEVGMIDLYKVKGKPYLQVTNWTIYQSIRAKTSKYPGLDEAEPTSVGNRDGTLTNTYKQNVTLLTSCEQTLTSCEHLHANVPEVEVEVENEVGVGIDICTEQARAQEESPEVVATMMCKDGEYKVTKTDIDQWHIAYPSVDISAEIKAMQAWLYSNQSRRKAKKNMPRFINGWLSRAREPRQNKASYSDMLAEWAGGDA